MLTRAKIAYNLHKTPYILERDYDGQTIKYHFSSELYMEKFKSRTEDNRYNIDFSLLNRFGFAINSALIADLRLYSSIEKRGYLISVNGEYVECQNNITLDGLKMTLRN